MDELVKRNARDIVKQLERGEIDPSTLIDASLARIDEVDPVVNAVPTLCVDRAREHAQRLRNQEPTKRGWLAGLPVLIKDLVEVEGVRTTHGSPIFKDNTSASSAIQAKRIEAHGGIILGKTNTPEFGAGAQTFNEVFGITRNPWDTRLTPAGSSGGAAVALATGMAWLADGSDLGGSLRTPAAFTSVVGLRPSPGRVPQGPGLTPFQTLSVAGPMARDVRDLALFLDVMAGFDPADPLSFDEPAISFAESVSRLPALGRIAFSADLGGITPVDPEVAAICSAAAKRVTDLGAELDDEIPDFSESVEIFRIQRAHLFAATRTTLLENYKDQLKPEVIWNIEEGWRLTSKEIGWSERARGALQKSVAEFFRTHDLLLCPAAILPPFPVEKRYIEELNGHRFQTYIDWVTVAFAITLAGCPALSLPCGFTKAGLPVGLQLVGPPRGEAKLLAAAAALEDLLGLADHVPIDPITPSA